MSGGEPGNKRARTLQFVLNGRGVVREVEPRRTLLELLRLDCGDTSPKEVCGAGNCGACTVLLDGKPVYSCLLLALECEGRTVTTVAGVGSAEELHPVQAAFLRADAYQCGFCTPGQILSAIALLDSDRELSEEEVVRGMSGNLCRCGAYRNIVRAVLDASREESSS